jgi:peptidoglycan hydrolase-like protein with peptidoglycan-binding domain
VAALHYLRNLTADRVAALHAAGLGVGTIFETLADESLGGAAVGAADGQTAAAQMRALGQPAGTVHAVNLADFAPTADQLPAIVAYWAAYRAATAAWQVIPYGTGWLAQAAHLAEWQNAMDNNGVPGSLVAAGAVLYQRVQPTLSIPGADYDEDVILAPLNWWAATPDPPPPPAPAPVPPGRRNVFTPVAVDGVFGVNTVKALQWVTFSGDRSQCDGLFGPASKRSLQTYLHVPADGIVGPVTVRALQKRVGAAVDGIWGAQTTMALQKVLNSGTF